MHDALTLLNELDQDQVKWIFDIGLSQQFPAGTPIIREGGDPDALYFVMEGLVGIYVSSVGDRCLAKLGPGEILGDISFLEGIQASASVVAIENSYLLVIPREKLDSKLKEDSEFSARLYRTFAVIACKRLRERERTYGHLLQSRAFNGHVITPAWERISGAVDEFKKLIQMADKEALKNEDVVPKKLARQVEADFKKFCEYINEEIGDESPENVHVKEDLGSRLQREILPYLLLTKTAERPYSKPRGYACDFQTIEGIYRNQPEGSGRLGPLIDSCFLNLPAIKAIRNGRSLMAQEIKKVVAEKDGTTAQITTLGSGPAEEIFDVFNQLDNPSSLNVTLIDIDLQALAIVSDRIEKKKLKKHVKLINGNLVYLAAGKYVVDLREQDLVYSIGLIESFNDKFVISLLDYIYQFLRTGGKVILGNIHPRNPDKALMDYVLDWHLVHRTEEGMHRLFTSSVFKKKCTEISFEDEGINLFASCVK